MHMEQGHDAKRYVGERESASDAPRYCGCEAAILRCRMGAPFGTPRAAAGVRRGRYLSPRRRRGRGLCRRCAGDVTTPAASLSSGKTGNATMAAALRAALAPSAAGGQQLGRRVFQVEGHFIPHDIQG